MGLLPFWAFAQGEGDMWFFGERALLDFKPTLAQQGAMPLARPGATQSAQECSSTLCTPDGRLLLYTNGWQLKDSNNANYANWVPDVNWNGNQTLTQGNLLLKVNDSTVFFIRANGSLTSQFHNQFFYRKIHLNRNNGLGWVDPVDYPAMDSITEQLAAVRHANGKDWWVLSHQAESNVFFKMLVSETGAVTMGRQTSIASTPRPSGCGTK